MPIQIRNSSSENVRVEIPKDVKDMTVREPQTRNAVLRLLAVLENCGLSASAPPILRTLENRG
jgi:hypothetical protein